MFPKKYVAVAAIQLKPRVSSFSNLYSDSLGFNLFKIWVLVDLATPVEHSECGLMLQQTEEQPNKLT